MLKPRILCFHHLPSYCAPIGFPLEWEIRISYWLLGILVSTTSLGTSGQGQGRLRARGALLVSSEIPKTPLSLQMALILKHLFSPSKSRYWMQFSFVSMVRAKSQDAAAACKLPGSLVPALSGRALPRPWPMLKWSWTKSKGGENAGLGAFMA